MSERFTEILRTASEPAWSDAVRHRFVKELFAGAVPDAVMARYLVQDHRFLDSFLTLLGATLASADTFEAQDLVRAGGRRIRTLGPSSAGFMRKPRSPPIASTGAPGYEALGRAAQIQLICSILRLRFRAAAKV